MNNASACLLIIDVQKGSINEHTQNIPRAVEALQQKYEKILISRFINRPQSVFRKWMKWHRFSSRSKDVQLAFAPRPNAKIFDKYGYTCITPEITRWIKRHKISEIHLCGVDTDCCVLATAIDLFEQGFRPVVLSRACASHVSRDFHKYGLKILRQILGAKQIED